MFRRTVGGLVINLNRSWTRGKSKQYMRLFDVLPKVRRSIDRGEPVVALESTIITHGMPYPNNLQTALEVEELVRANNAVPATIAIIDGRVKVGLVKEDLVRLASMPHNEVIKCSRRDLPYILANRLTGGTTVAATMIVAHMMGLRVFATGGIGGVHQQGHITMDISADLVELGRTPIAVVCSGIKSILDIPRTLEYLETEGVCVATYGDANGHFPDFYTRDSGCKVPYNLNGPEEAARLISILHEMKLRSGILIGVPIPEEHATDKKIITEAMDNAYLEAEEQCVTGKEVTPFLLAAISKITQGDSLKANIALIKNNASVAARIACELSRLKSNPSVKIIKHTPLIVGSCIMDVLLKMKDDMPDTLDGATFEANAKQSAGGVGRNLAEGIFKLHGSVNFISAVGNDQFGKNLLQLLPKPLQRGVNIVTEKATSLCSILFDRMGDCKLILGNMDIHQCITPDCILKQESLLSSAPLIIMDGNISVLTMECILELAKKHQRPVFFEPTDMRIGGKPFTLPRFLTKQIKIISPNVYELKTIVEAITKCPLDLKVNLSASTSELLEQVKCMIHLIQDDFDCIVVTMGHHGICLSAAIPDDKAWFDPESGLYKGSTTEVSSDRILKFYAAPKVEQVTNVSGAGDSFTCGFVTGLLRCYDLDRCVALGFLAAERALQSESAVPTQYFGSENEQFKHLRNAVKFLQKKNF